MGLFDNFIKGVKEKSKELQESGAIDDFLKGIGDAATKQIRNKYRAMSNDELKAEWEKVFKNLGFTPNNMYQPDSLYAILDEEYGLRINRENWKMKYEKDMRKQQAAKEEIRKRQEAENKRIAFKNSLGSNDMVKQILDKIDKLGYEAFVVCVYEEEVAVFNEKEKEILSVKYVRYGYPKLNDQQIDDFTEYLQNNLKLRYEINEDGDLKLNDAPGGMKASW